MLRYLTAGESHGTHLVGILEGMVANLKVSNSKIDADLKRRWAGYGRGGRSKIESDHAEILSGMRKGMTMGSPIALVIKNKSADIDKLPKITSPRPGHADLAGALKYNQKDIRNILERSSARETATRVAIGAICRQFLSEFSIKVTSRVITIGGVKGEKAMRGKIDKAKKDKDTLGGVFEVIIKGAPVGLGSHVQYDRKLDARLALSVMSIQAIKGVEIGLGFEAAIRRGSKMHDEIIMKNKDLSRKTNNAGGIEGGMSNGEDIIVRAAMKPIATLGKPLASVDIISKKATKGAVERHDICAVESAGVVGEAVCAFEIANALLEKFGGDSLEETKKNFKK